MAEVYEEEVGEEVPLSAEELFEQHKAEIEAAFEEKGFFRRLSEMFSGLSKPRTSAEYKLARIELQRLAAPVLAVVLPVLGVVVLIVVTAVNSGGDDEITVDIAQAVEEEQKLEEEPEEVDETPPDETVDVVIDTPVVGPVSDMISPAPPTNEPLSVKPAVEDSVAIIKSPFTMRSMTGSRTPGTIGQMTRGGAGYGDPTTEAAVLKALRWLKKTQKSDGSWEGVAPANTGLAILTFLAHGETPSKSKEFGATVERAIEYLINSQTLETKGASFKGVDGNEYATLIATYALGEAYGMTKNPSVKQPALNAMERIISNQSATGGWDYKLNKNSTRDDVSFGGWALQALKACKMAGLHPDGLDECIKKAIKCLKTRNYKNGTFKYTADTAHYPGLTATGCLAMQLLGYMNEPEVKGALDYMREWKPAFKASGNSSAGGPLPGPAALYYCYYAAQCKYQAGMCQGAVPANVKIWQEWNLAMKALYPKTILDGGTIEGVDGKPKACGYWKATGDNGGRDNTMTTCLCALQLMVYYRYLPTTQTKAAKVEDDSSSTDKKKLDVDISVDI